MFIRYMIRRKHNKPAKILEDDDIEKIIEDIRLDVEKLPKVKQVLFHIEVKMDYIMLRLYIKYIEHKNKRRLH